MKRRVKIPSSISTAVLFASDRTCCVCQNRALAVQIHHVDSDPGNNDRKNLAVLCLEHHSQATGGPGLGRGLSAELVVKYQSEWVKRVAASRRLASRGSTQRLDRGQMHELMQSAIACHEIARLRSVNRHAGRSQQGQLLARLREYLAENPTYEVRSECLSTVYGIASYGRSGMPILLAEDVRSTMMHVLPMHSLVGKAPYKIGKETITLLERGAEVGRTLAYDAVAYLKSLPVTFSGTRLMSDVFRFAKLNLLHKVKADLVDAFENLIDVAKKRDFEDGRRWIRYEMEAATSFPQWNVLEPPDLENRLDEEFSREESKRSSVKTEKP